MEFIGHPLNVERVLKFEQEMEKRLQDLTKVEKDIIHVGQQRKEWLENITITERTEKTVYNKRLEILKAQAELSSLQMTADILNVEGHYEAQTLNYLIESTKPIDALGLSEATIHAREIELQNLSRKDNQKLAECLLQSIEFRSKLGNLNYDLTSEIRKMKVVIEADHTHKTEETKEKLMTYLERMEASIARSKAIHKKTTSEYLVLRHNAKVAKEILLRSQNESHLLREELQKKLEDLRVEAELQHTRIEESSKQEIVILTRDLRASVMAKESEHEALKNRVETLSRAKAKDLKHIKIEIRRYDKLHNQLQRSRKHDVKTITAELRRLKELIMDAEQKLALSAYTDRGIESHYVEVGDIDEVERYLQGLQLDGGGGGRNGGGNRADAESIVRKLKEKLKEIEVVRNNGEGGGLKTAKPVSAVAATQRRRPLSAKV